MEKLRTWLEKVYDRRICQQYDLLCPVVADEGKGKSTLMLELVWLYQEVRGMEPDHETVLDSVVWDQEGFKRALADWEPRRAITVQDAARVLHKREAMRPDQIEVEKDLLDVRTKEFLMFLGFQDWNVIPTSLQKRRAKALLYIPTRGRVWGYSRQTLNERVGSDEWPDPDLKASFPSLEGRTVWEEFQRRDIEQKQERIRGDLDEEEEQTWSPPEVVEDIKDEGVSQYVAKNEFNGQVYIDADLIQYDYDMTVRGAKQVKKVLSRQVDVESHLPADDSSGSAGEGGTHTA